MAKKENGTDTWLEAANGILKGDRVARCSRMTPEQMAREGWGDGWQQPPMVIEFQSGVKLFASTDEEGNGPGAMFGEADGQSIRLL